MANNNLNNCMRAVQQLGLTDKVKITVGKNPKQATRLEFNGVSKSVSALYRINEFIDLFHEWNNASMATAKVEHAHVGGDKQSQQMTYVKNELANFTGLDVKNNKTLKGLYNVLKDSTDINKSSYYYGLRLNTILNQVLEDYGMNYKTLMQYHKSWDSDEGWKANTKLLIEKNGLFVPVATFQQVIKKWLKFNNKKANDEQIEMIINKWVKIGGQ